MRKTILAFLLVVVGASTAAAQNYDQAFGLRLGTMVGASYKQFVNSSQAFEAIADLDILHSDAMVVRATALYEFHIPIYSVDGLSWYIGPGVSAGVQLGDDSGFILGLDAIGGIEYKLASLPFCFSLDYNPKIFLLGYEKAKDKLSWANLGLTIRYTF